MRRSPIATIAPLAQAAKRPCVEVPAVSSLDNPPTDGGANVVNGSGFLALQGTGKVQIGNANTRAGSATLVDQTVTAWSDTAINVTHVQGALPGAPMPVYLFVENDCGNVNELGYQTFFV